MILQTIRMDLLHNYGRDDRFLAQMTSQYEEQGGDIRQPR